MNASNIVTVDFETDNSKGLGLQIWHPDFKVTSAAFLVADDNDSTFFSTDVYEIGKTLRFFYQNNYEFLVYNAGFDCAIMEHIFKLPEAFHRSIDAWRLAGYCNMTVDDKHAMKKGRNTSLVGSVKYFFDEESYKKPFEDVIISMGLAKTHKQAHANIAALPPELLKEYNIADVVQTWRIYKHCINLLENEWGVPWRHDHDLYMNEAYLYARSSFRGIQIDQALLKESLRDLEEEIATIDGELRSSEYVKEAERRLTKKRDKVSHPMRKKHRKAHEELYFMAEPSDEEVLEWFNSQLTHVFSWHSSKDKIMLFIDILGLPVIKLTNGGKKGKPQPKVSKDTLREYGEIGKKLLLLLKRMKEHKELSTLQYLSSFDGLFHPMLRSSTTVSSRSSSSSGS